MVCVGRVMVSEGARGFYLLQKTVLYPEPRGTGQVGTAALDEISAYRPKRCSGSEPPQRVRIDESQLFYMESI